MLTERTPEAHRTAVEHFKGLRSSGQFVPPSRQGTIIFPGFDGGAEWGGPGFDPTTGLLYVNSNEMAWVLRMIEQKPYFGPSDWTNDLPDRMLSLSRSRNEGQPT